MSRNIFITGTGTDIGKTYISALLVKYLKDIGFRSGYYKAAVSGNKRINGELIAEDALFVKNLAGLTQEANEMVSYIYEEPLSPHLASEREHRFVELNKIKNDYEKICAQNDFVTMEGSGGIICPIRYNNEKIMLEDIIKMLNLSVIIVSNAKLGSINSAALTVSYLREKRIPIKGIILNCFDPYDFMEQDNRKMIEEITQTKIIAAVEHGQTNMKFEGIERLYE